MKCIEFISEPARCKRGIPVGQLFRHYFCEGNHKRCPLKEMEKKEKHRAVRRLENSLIEQGEA